MQALIAEARQFLRGKIRHTPIEHSPELSDRLGVEVWLKLEFLQITGSFKIRGALFKLARTAAPAVLTCSAGNHGKAVAYAAKQLGKRAVVCVPSSVDPVKRRGIEQLGAEIRIAPFRGYDETEDWAIEQAAREQLPFISPFDDEEIIAANGGALADELLEDVPSLRTVVLAVGGGGQAAGFAADPRIAHIVGCQHAAASGLEASLAAGRAVTRLPSIETVAGGIEGGLGVTPFEHLRNRIAEVALVSEDEILEGMRWMLDAHQYLIEPSSAAAIAACLQAPKHQWEGPVAIVLTGRNVSLAVIKQALSKH